MASQDTPRWKLSERALEILRLVDQSTVWDGTDRPGVHLRRFCQVPSLEPGSNSVEMPDGTKRDIHIGGYGDENIVKSLLKKRLVRWIAPHAYAITENGMLAIQDDEERRRSRGEIR